MSLPIEIAIVSQSPKNITEKEKFTEILTIIDTTTNQRKSIATIPVNQSKHTNENIGMYKSILSGGLKKLTVDKNYGLIVAADQKPLLYNFKIGSNNIQTTSSRGAQIISLGSVSSKIGEIASVNFDESETLLAISIEEKLYLWHFDERLSTSSEEANGSSSGPQLVATLTHHTQKISKIIFSKTKNFLITAANDSYINIYSIFDIFENGNKTLPLHQMKGNELEITGLGVLNCNQKFLRIVCGGNDGFIRYWMVDVTKSRIESILKGTNEDQCGPSLSKISKKSSSRGHTLGLIHNEIIKQEFSTPVVLFAVDSNLLNCYVTTLDSKKNIKKFSSTSNRVENFKSSGGTGVFGVLGSF